MSADVSLGVHSHTQHKTKKKEEFYFLALKMIESDIIKKRISHVRPKHKTKFLCASTDKNVLYVGDKQAESERSKMEYFFFLVVDPPK